MLVVYAWLSVFLTGSTIVCMLVYYLSKLATLIPYTQVVISLTGIP